MSWRIVAGWGSSESLSLLTEKTNSSVLVGLKPTKISSGLLGPEKVDEGGAMIAGLRHSQKCERPSPEP